MLTIGSYTPDMPEYEVTGALEKLNVIPENGYCRPLPTFGTIGGAMDARVRGAISARGVNGEVANFAGTATKLYKWDSAGNLWVEVSRLSGGPYAVPSDGRWAFSKFGDRVIADNGFDASQAFIINSSTNFDALGGSPPLAACNATIRDFHVKGRVNTANNRVQWSGINNVLTYGSSQATQADFQDLPDGGAVQWIVGGEYGLVFQEKAIKRMTYANLPLIWRFDEISTGIGTPAPGSVARYESQVFFLSEHGFFRVLGGSQLQAIGHDRVDRLFWEHPQHGVNISFLDRITSAVDPLNNLYILSYPSSNSGDGTPNRLLIYNWKSDEWARAEVTLELLHQAATQSGFTLDNLDAVFGNLDAIGISLDSTLFSGTGKLLLAGFGIDHKIGFFNGVPMPATVDTGEAEVIKGHRAKVRAMRPIVDGGTPVIRIGKRNRTTDAVTFGAASTMNAFGVCPVLENARYMRGRIEMASGDTWKKLQGVDDIQATSAGRV